MLGRILGYRILAEYKMNSLCERIGISCPKHQKNLSVDMVWWQDAKKAQIYGLVVELQQDKAIKKITNDIRKLAILKAELKVLYCFARSKGIKKVLDTIEKEMRKNAENQRLFLAIIDPWISPKTFDDGTLKAFLLDKDSRITSRGEALVHTKIDMDHKIRVFRNARWFDVSTT